MWQSIKKTYRTIVPAAIRSSSLVQTIKGKLSHDFIYDAEYYRNVIDGPATRSADTIAESIIRQIHPKSVMDVGCGTGAMMEALIRKGCDCTGLEYSVAALKYCVERKLKVSRFNIAEDAYDSAQTFDLVISMEVAEHLPEKFADRYLDLLTRLAPVVVFTAAPPGQGGTDHVNEQPPSYWLKRFKVRGFIWDEKLSKDFRAAWKLSGRVESWYYQNLLILKKAGAGGIPANVSHET